MTTAYQVNAYQPNAYQTQAVVAQPAFEACSFQFGAFQSDVCPIPPEPVLNDGHDGGRKKALKKLKELEDKRIAMVRKDAEHRKMLIRHAIDPQAKAEYEAKLRAQEAKFKDVKAEHHEDATARELAHIDAEMAKITNLRQNLKYKAIISAELGKIQAERAIREHEIRKAIQQADDELALMMMM